MIPEAEKKAEKALVKDEHVGYTEYMRRAAEADREGRHEDAEVFRAHAKDEMRHEAEDRKIVNEPDAPEQWAQGAVNPEHKQAVVVATPGKSTDLSIKPMPVEAIVPTQAVNEDRVQHFQEAIKRGETIPPILVHRLPNGKMEVIDGQHRLEAYRRLGVKEIPVVENDLSDVARQLGGGAYKIISTIKKATTGASEGYNEEKEADQEAEAARRRVKEMASLSRHIKNIDAVATKAAQES